MWINFFVWALVCITVLHSGAKYHSVISPSRQLRVCYYCDARGARETGGFPHIVLQPRSDWARRLGTSSRIYCVVLCCVASLRLELFPHLLLPSLKFRVVRERAAVSCCEPSLVYFQSGDVSAAQQLVIARLLGRDWLALVAVEAFVDSARGGGRRGRSHYKTDVDSVDSSTERGKQRGEVAGKPRTSNNNNSPDLLIYRRKLVFSL